MPAESGPGGARRAKSHGSRNGVRLQCELARCAATLLLSFESQNSFLAMNVEAARVRSHGQAFHGTTGDSVDHLEFGSSVPHAVSSRKAPRGAAFPSCNRDSLLYTPCKYADTVQHLIRSR